MSSSLHSGRQLASTAPCMRVDGMVVPTPRHATARARERAARARAVERCSARLQRVLAKTSADCACAVHRRHVLTLVARATLDSRALHRQEGLASFGISPRRWPTKHMRPPRSRILTINILHHRNRLLLLLRCRRRRRRLLLLLVVRGVVHVAARVTLLGLLIGR